MILYLCKHYVVIERVMYIKYLDEFLKHSKLLKCIISERIHNKDEIEDVYQSVFLKGFKYYKNIRNSNYFKNWICQIAKNEVKLNYKCYKKKITTLIEYEKLWIKPKNQYIRLEEQLVVKEVMNDIKSVDSEVIDLYHFKSYSYQEIAQILDLNINTVKSRIRKARIRMNKKFKKYYQ